MDANQISMGKLLTYLFEVTQRFGMETRTELILFTTNYDCRGGGRADRCTLKLISGRLPNQLCKTTLTKVLGQKHSLMI